MLCCNWKVKVRKAGGAALLRLFPELSERRCLAGARAAGPNHWAAGGSVQEEEPHRPAGPSDSHPQREHQHPHQGAGAQGQGGAEDPQRSQSADQVVTHEPRVLPDSNGSLDSTASAVNTSTCFPDGTRWLRGWPSVTGVPSGRVQTEVLWLGLSHWTQCNAESLSSCILEVIPSSSRACTRKSLLGLFRPIQKQDGFSFLFVRAHFCVAAASSHSHASQSLSQMPQTKRRAATLCSMLIFKLDYIQNINDAAVNALVGVRVHAFNLCNSTHWAQLNVLGASTRVG